MLLPKRTNADVVPFQTCSLCAQPIWRAQGLQLGMGYHCWVVARGGRCSLGRGGVAGVVHAMDAVSAPRFRACESVSPSLLR